MDTIIRAFDDKNGYDTVKNNIPKDFKPLEVKKMLFPRIYWTKCILVLILFLKWLKIWKRNTWHKQNVNWHWEGIDQRRAIEKVEEEAAAEKAKKIAQLEGIAEKLKKKMEEEKAAAEKVVAENAAAEEILAIAAKSREDEKLKRENYLTKLFEFFMIPVFIIAVSLIVLLIYGFSTVLKTSNGSRVY